ncbi:MAG: type I phosphomannose isomerase catalytic subunit [Hungatella sp.]
MSEILWITPVFVEMIWGGERLHTEFGYTIPSDHTGECWAISAHPNGNCRITSGTYEGYSLSRLWEEHRELFGGMKGAQFPLLVKIIDAKTDLSIQVHPDDAYAALHEHGSLGKTECWYILDCEADSQIVIGHHAKSKTEVEEMITEKRWDDFIRVVPIKKGDFFQIAPGCVHAIKGGTLILETQQNSDITYRVYDYDRLSDGKLRQLHVQQSIDTIVAPFVEETHSTQVISYPHAVCTNYIRCAFYCVDHYRVFGEFTQDFQAPFTNVSIIEGEGRIDGTAFQKGQHFIIPGDYGTCHFEGDFAMICSNPQA